MTLIQIDLSTMVEQYLVVNTTFTGVMMKITEVKWFCGRSNVGIVRVIDEYEGPKYYIGAVAGLNEDTDIQWIADWGSTFPKDAGDVLFGVNK